MLTGSLLLSHQLGGGLLVTGHLRAALGVLRLLFRGGYAKRSRN